GAQREDVVADEFEEGTSGEIRTRPSCDLDRDPQLAKRDFDCRGCAARDEFVPGGRADHEEVTRHHAPMQVALRRLRAAAHLDAQSDHRVKLSRRAVPYNAHTWCLGGEEPQAAEHPGFNAGLVGGLLAQEVYLPR